jgi:hypothetical protein
MNDDPKPAMQTPAEAYRAATGVRLTGEAKTSWLARLRGARSESQARSSNAAPPTMMRPASTPEEFVRALGMPVQPREPAPITFDLWACSRATLELLVADLGRRQPEIARVVDAHLRSRESQNLVSF